MGQAIKKVDVMEVLVSAMRLGLADDLTDRIMAKIEELDPCYAKAGRVGAPIFVLSATDDIAPDIVRAWSDQAADLPEGSKRRERAGEAAEQADVMEAWAKAYAEAGEPE